MADIATNEVIEGQISQPQPMALEGLRIVDLTVAGAGPRATMYLGQLGAEILKIELPGTGDSLRGLLERPNATDKQHIVWEDCGANKKSITLDLHKEKAQNILHRLVATADVFTCNLLPEARERFKVDYPTLVKYNPKLIYIAGTIYGPKGPDRNRHGNATHGGARSGLMTIPVDDDRPVTPPIAAIGDEIHGLTMAFGVMVGLWAREKLGIGQEIYLSQLGSIMNTLNRFHMEQAIFYGIHRIPPSHNKRDPMANTYLCNDGKWMLISDRVNKAGDWHDFCQAVGKPELENDPRFKDEASRLKNNEALIEILDDIFVTRTAKEWYGILRTTHLAYSVVNELTDLPDDPMVIANHYLWDVDHPRFGKIKWPGHPLTFSKTPATLRTFAPDLGQHTEEVLTTILNFSHEEVAKLKEEGII